MRRALPVLSSISMSAPCSHVSRFAGSKPMGRWVRKRSMASSLRTPITESHGPHIPTSVMKAVPPASTRLSAVWMWVWVPTTAETLPSRKWPMAFFSLEASQCMSTRITMLHPWDRRSSTSLAAMRKGSSSVFMKTRPSRFTTPTLRPSRVSTTAWPRPGEPSG